MILRVIPILAALLVSTSSVYAGNGRICLKDFDRVVESFELEKPQAAKKKTSRGEASNSTVDFFRSQVEFNHESVALRFNF